MESVTALNRYKVHFIFTALSSLMRFGMQICTVAHINHLYSADL